MERRGPVGKLALTLGLTALIGGGVLTRPHEHIMSADDWFLRQEVLMSYPFTYEAVTYLNTVPFFNRNTSERGGGLWHGQELFPYVEVFSNQHEAAVHELSHAFYDKIVKDDPEFPIRFMEDVNYVADNDRPSNGRMYGYYSELRNGKPGQEFKGIPQNNVTEYFASISSHVMTNENGVFPEPLEDDYKLLFREEWKP